MTPRTKVLLIPSTSKKYGGDLYEDEVIQVLTRKHEVDVRQVIPDRAKTSRPMAVPAYLKNLREVRESDAKIVIRSMNNPFFMSTNTKNVLIAYHYDTRFCHPLVRAHTHMTYLSMLKQRHKIDRLVVICDFWADYFRARGFERITTIRSAVSAKDFEITPAEIEAFKTKYGLNGKKVIYIGNPQRKKGTDKVAAALKDRGYMLVASGNADTPIPALTLKLDFREYVALLHSVGLVITMSQINEGWCRQAHEAMLCGKPVIGSGLGGMKELLDAGQQLICDDFAKLPELVETAYANRELGELGRRGALRFEAGAFEQQWLNLVEELTAKHAPLA